MRVSNRKALDSGKQSGVGRVVATFFDLCNQICSGSPATESMTSCLNGAVNSADAQSHSFQSSTGNTTFQSRSSTPQATCNNDRSDECNEDEDTESSLECENTNDVESKEKKSSREKIKEMLSNRRNRKLRKNILIDQQILAFNKEEMEIKHEMLRKMELQDQQLSRSVEAFQENISNFTNILSQSIQMMTASFKP